MIGPAWRGRADPGLAAAPSDTNSTFSAQANHLSEDDSAETDGAEDSDQTRSIPVRLQKGMCISAVPGSRFSGHDDRTKKELNESARNFLRQMGGATGASRQWLGPAN